MRPANQQQAERQMDYLLKSRINGSRIKIMEHLKRARQIAAVLWRRYQIGPYQYRRKHIDWYLSTRLSVYSETTSYRHWLTVKLILKALDKDVWY